MSASLPVDVLRMNNRRTIRGRVNPLDKCTIVSIFPKKIRERKATIYPGVFELKEGSYDNPSFLVVGPSSWWKNVDTDDTPQPLLEISVSSPEIAEDFVKCYSNGLLGITNSAKPGLFFLLGDHSIKDKDGNISYDATVKHIKAKFAKELDEAHEKQQRWFHNLVDLADALFVGSNGNSLAVSQDMKMAADILGIKGKTWMANTENMSSVRCVACGALRNPEYPVCGSCHAVIDKKKAEELGLVFAK